MVRGKKWKRRARDRESLELKNHIFIISISRRTEGTYTRDLNARKSKNMEVVTRVSCEKWVYN